jgi:hypothetical protein
MMEREVSRLSRLRNPGQMRGRERENAMHNEGMACGNAQEPSDVSGAFGYGRVG